jgi:hypothetical protein
MQPSRHPETAERKQSEPQNRGAALSKTTNDQQEAGLTALRDKSTLPAFVEADFSLSQMAPKEGWSPGVTRAGRVGADGEK